MRRLQQSCLGPVGVLQLAVFMEHNHILGHGQEILRGKAWPWWSSPPPSRTPTTWSLAGLRPDGSIGSPRMLLIGRERWPPRSPPMSGGAGRRQGPTQLSTQRWTAPNWAAFMSEQTFTELYGRAMNAAADSPEASEDRSPRRTSLLSQAADESSCAPQRETHEAWLDRGQVAQWRRERPPRCLNACTGDRRRRLRRARPRNEPAANGPDKVAEPESGEAFEADRRGRFVELSGQRPDRGPWSRSACGPSHGRGGRADATYSPGAGNAPARPPTRATGWRLDMASENESYWNRRGERPGHDVRRDVGG